MVFGVFDGLHDGHRAFFRQARFTGSKKNVDKTRLIACVARDEVVEQLKGHRPKSGLELRVQKIRDSGLADKVVEGDEKLGAWSVIGKYKPDVIALGYDQNELRTALLSYLRENNSEAEVRVMDGYQTEKYHSSLLNN